VVTFEGTLLIINDRHKNPLAVVQSLGANETTIILANDPDFKSLIKSLGIDRTAIVNQFRLADSAVGKVL